MKIIYRIIALILAVTGLFSGTKDYLTEREFQNTAKRAAVISLDNIHETIYKETKQKGMLGTKKVSYFSTHTASVIFDTEEKKQISVEREIPGDVLLSYNSKEQVSIRYLPSNPEIIRWMGEPATDYSLNLIVGGLALLYLIFSFTILKND